MNIDEHGHGISFVLENVLAIREHRLLMAEAQSSDRPRCLSAGGRSVCGEQQKWYYDEGLTGMKVDGKRKLLVPAEMGYGDRGFGEKIPPNSNLIFEIELLEALNRE